MSKIKHILSVIHHTICGVVCFQFTHFPCGGWDNIYTVSYYHHQIGIINYNPLFGVRSWNNGMRCLSKARRRWFETSLSPLWRHYYELFVKNISCLKRCILRHLSRHSWLLASEKCLALRHFLCSKCHAGDEYSRGEQTCLKHEPDDSNHAWRNIGHMGLFSFLYTFFCIWLDRVARTNIIDYVCVCVFEVCAPS